MRQSKISFLFTGRNRKSLTTWAFLSVSLLGTAFFWLLPVLDVVRRSFQDPSGTRFAGLQNYEAVFSNASFRLAAANTAKFILTGIPLLLALSLVLAVWVRGLDKRSGNSVRAIFLLPMVLPVSALSFVWKLFFDTEGILNRALTGLGWGAVDFIGSDCAFGVLLFTYIWRNFGYAMVLWLAAMDGIAPEVYEAARMDGAGEVRIFFRMTLPLLRPVSFTIVFCPY